MPISKLLKCISCSKSHDCSLESCEEIEIEIIRGDEKKMKTEQITKVGKYNLRSCPLCSSTELSIGSECYGHGCYSDSIECKCGLKFSKYDDGDIEKCWNDRT